MIDWFAAETALGALEAPHATLLVAETLNALVDLPVVLRGGFFTRSASLVHGTSETLKAHYAK